MIQKQLLILLFLTLSLFAQNNELLHSLRELEDQYLQKLLDQNVSLEPIEGKSPLNCIAVNLNFVSKVELLLEKDIDLSYKDNDGNTIIQNYQILIKRYSELYKLIDSKTPKELQTIESVPPTYKKIVLRQRGKKVVLQSISYAQMLLKRAIKLVYKKSHQLTLAIIENNTTKALQLLKDGADTYEYGNEDSIKKIITPNLHTTYVGGMEYRAYPVVILAAVQGNVDVIQALHDRFEFSVYFKDKQGNDALMWAARQNRVEVVKQLLEYGLDPLREVSDMSAFDLALRFKSIGVLKLFIKKLLKEKNQEPLSRAIWSMARDDSDTVEMLVNAGVKDSYKGVSPRTSLMKVAEMGNIQRFELLVKHGSDPYESNKGSVHFGYNPLIAAIYNSQKMAKHLLQNYHYDLTQVYEGKNLLHIAYNHYKRADKELIKLILEKSKLDINSLNKYGMTLLQVAVDEQDKEYLQFFLSLGYSQENFLKAMKVAKAELESLEKQYEKVKNLYTFEKFNKAKEIVKILENRSSK